MVAAVAAGAGAAGAGAGAVECGGNWRGIES